MEFFVTPQYLGQEAKKAGLNLVNIYYFNQYPNFRTLTKNEKIVSALYYSFIMVPIKSEMKSMTKPVPSVENISIVSESVVSKNKKELQEKVVSESKINQIPLENIQEEIKKNPDVKWADIQEKEGFEFDDTEIVEVLENEEIVE